MNSFISINIYFILSIKYKYNLIKVIRLRILIYLYKIIILFVIYNKIYR